MNLFLVLPSLAVLGLSTLAPLSTGVHPASDPAVVPGQTHLFIHRVAMNNKLGSSGEKVEKPNLACSLPPDSGKIVYDTYCLGCHQADGRGVPGLNPPLAKTDWVLGDKTRLIGVVLRGLNEEIEINGETFDNAMPAHNFLTDKQIAEVLSYVRSHFGNQAEAIKPEEVRKAR